MTAARGFLVSFLLLGCGAALPAGQPPAAPKAACQRDGDCPGATSPCRSAVCREGRCEVELARPGTVPVEGQKQGDCRRFICGVGGELIAREDPSDVPADDGDPCTREVCNGEVAGRMREPEGAPCGVGVCSSAGACVGLEEIAVGRYHGCLRLGGGAVRCWGLNDRGQVSGEDIGGIVESPTTVQGLPAASALALGGSHSCAIAGGQVMCWGANQQGQLGDGSTADRTAPVAAQGVSAATALSVGLDTSCAVSGGSVFCWGLGDSGQLGHGKRSSSPLPVRVAWPQGAGPAGAVAKAAGPAQLAVGGSHACAVTTGGKLFCWGANGLGQLGDGSTVDRPAPVAALLDDVRQASAGRNHTCALRGDGTVWCWGQNNDGQLGKGDRNPLQRPAQIASLKGAVEVACGNGHSCARFADGKVRCWGWNNDGQVASSSVGDALDPVELSSPQNAAQLALGSKHSCARLAGASFVCWGSGSRGQLGQPPPAPPAP